MEPEQQANGKAPVNGYAELRRLLVGPEQEEIALLRRRLDELKVDASLVGELLPAAVKLRLQRDGALRASLQPLIEEAIFVSVQKHPQVLAAALFPIIGSAVRKAVASALRALTQSLNQMVEQSLSWRSLLWRWEAIRTGKPFVEILLARSLLYKVEQVFLIHRKTGLLLRQEAAEAVVIRDPDLVSGMLTAIQDFVQDSFGALPSDELETLRVGDYDVWIQHAPLAILAVVIRGSPPREIRNFFESQLEKICSGRTLDLEKFRGDASAFRSCEADLRACLLGRAAPGKRRLGWFWKLAGVVALLALGWGVFILVRDQVRWNRYLGRLRAEPGIVVTAAERNWFSYGASGLRDPLAADPVAMLAGAGIDSHKVAFRWEPYRSLDAGFELQRRLAGERESVESQTFHFEADKIDLPVEELSAIRETARHLQLLFELAARSGQTASVEIAGHTDDTGRPERNAELSAGRAVSVRNAIESQQIPADRLQARPSGAVPGGSDASRPLNRYVSLRVTLAPR